MMMSLNDEKNLTSLLRDAIAHRDDDEAEDPGELLTALITSAVHDEAPNYSLKDIYVAIANAGATQDLDALSVVPALVRSDKDGTMDIIGLLSECGSAKEVFIAAQEALEHLKHDLESSEETDDEHTHASKKLGYILSIHIGSITRLKLRKKSPVDTVRPLIADLGPTLQLASGHLNKAQAHEIIRRICDLISSVISFTNSQEQSTLDNSHKADPTRSEVTKLCLELLIQSLESFSPLLDFGLAQRKFEEVYPRLRMKGTATAGPDIGLLSSINDTAILLSLSMTNLLHTQSMGGLVLLAYTLSVQPSPTSLPQTPSLLKALLPLLISLLQSSFALDESLFVLLTTIHSSSCPSTLDPDVITPLIRTLAPLASVHPSPQTRHIAFRILGTLLSHLPPLDRMYILRDLLSDSEDNFPPMRVAAVGLLKDAVLEAISSDEKNAFASPMLFDIIVGKMLRFDGDVGNRGLADLIETGETKRLVEMLSFCYILLVRDKDNRTGVRDSGHINAIKSNFLDPLRSATVGWKAHAESDHEQQFALISLDIALQRVEEHLSVLQN